MSNMLHMASIMNADRLKNLWIWFKSALN
jgi:hypothetical protein